MKRRIRPPRPPRPSPDAARQAVATCAPRPRVTLRRVVALVWAAWAATSCAPASCRAPASAARAESITALIRAGDYVAAEAEARAFVEAVGRARGERSLEAAAASDLLVRALVANGKGSAPETLAVASETAERWQARLGSQDPGLVPSLQNLGDVFAAAHKYDRAIHVLERALATQEKEVGRGVELTQTLNRLSHALREANRFDDAVAFAERSVRLAAEPGDRRELARSLEVLARALQRRGDYEKARDIVVKAVNLRRVDDADHPEYIETLSVLSYQEWSQGRLDAARDAAAAAVALAQRTLRADHPTLAQSLRQLAGARLDLWDIEGAHDLGSQAVAMAERGLSPTHPAIAGYLNDLAASTVLLGRYEDARRLYERSLAVAERQYGEAHELSATIIYNLAEVDAHLGDLSRAEREYRRAGAVWQRLHGADHPFVAQALTAQALAVRDQARPSEALELLERALAINQRALGLQHRAVANTLTQIAEAFMRLGRSSDARRASDRALRIWVAAGSPDAHEHAVALALSAELGFERGDVRAARSAYERALAMTGRVFGTGHPEFADVRLGLARTLARSGEYVAAFAGARDAEEIGREHLRLMLRSLPEREALNYARVRPRGLELLLSLAGLEPRAAAAGLDALIRSRALVLDEVAARRRDAATAADPSQIALAGALASAQQRVANLIVRGAGSMSPTRYAGLLEAARNDSESAERRLAEASAAFRGERSRAQAGLESVTRALPPNTVLVSFVRYQQLALGGQARYAQAIGRGPAADETPSYVAFVLRAGWTPQAVKLGAAQAIDELVSRWRGDIAAEALEPRTASSVRRVSSRVSGAGLRAKIWDPLSQHLNDVGQVLIVPDGTLGLVPFAALPVGRESFVLEQAPPIHYLSAERDVVSAGASSVSATGMLAVGGPAFDDAPGSPPASSHASAGTATALSARRNVRTACASLESLRFQPLDGTLQEARELSRLWPTPLGAARTLVGNEASEHVFKQQAHGYRVLHLATHGFFLDGSCLPESTRAGTRGVGGLSSTKAVENPLRLSGLALAGANRRAQARADEDDGILTAEEVAMLDLQGVDWAVLSACDTGVGEIRAGEGVFGLRRAFQVAGARTVVMSLWSVDDQATRAWMRALYEGRFQKKLSTADAVHQASLSVLRDRRARGQSTHPFYWAAFVAAGDWR